MTEELSRINPTHTRIFVACGSDYVHGTTVPPGKLPTREFLARRTKGETLTVFFSDKGIEEERHEYDEEGLLRYIESATPKYGGADVNGCKVTLSGTGVEKLTPKKEVPRG